jgi:hypothetical protein
MFNSTNGEGNRRRNFAGLMFCKIKKSALKLKEKISAAVAMV